MINDGVGAAVYVVNPDGSRVTRTPVRIKRFDQDRVAVTDGISEGDRVVTLGVHMLDDAKPVRVIEKRADLR